MAAAYYKESVYVRVVGVDKAYISENVRGPSR